MSRLQSSQSPTATDHHTQNEWVKFPESRDALDKFKQEEKNKLENHTAISGAWLRDCFKQFIGVMDIFEKRLTDPISPGVPSGMLKELHGLGRVIRSLKSIADRDEALPRDPQSPNLEVEVWTEYKTLCNQIQTVVKPYQWKRTLCDFLTDEDNQKKSRGEQLNTYSGPTFETVSRPWKERAPYAYYSIKNLIEARQLLLTVMLDTSATGIKQCEFEQRKWEGSLSNQLRKLFQVKVPPHPARIELHKLQDCLNIIEREAKKELSCVSNAMLVRLEVAARSNDLKNGDLIYDTVKQYEENTRGELKLNINGVMTPLPYDKPEPERDLTPEALANFAETIECYGASDVRDRLHKLPWFEDDPCVYDPEEKRWKVGDVKLQDNNTVTVPVPNSLGWDKGFLRRGRAACYKAFHDVSRRWYGSMAGRHAITLCETFANNKDNVFLSDIDCSRLRENSQLLREERRRIAALQKKLTFFQGKTRRILANYQDRLTQHLKQVATAQITALKRISTNLSSRLSTNSPILADDSSTLVYAQSLIKDINETLASLPQSLVEFTQEGQSAISEFSKQLKYQRLKTLKKHLEQEQKLESWVTVYSNEDGRPLYRKPNPCAVFGEEALQSITAYLQDDEVRAVRIIVRAMHGDFVVAGPPERFLTYGDIKEAATTLAGTDSEDIIDPLIGNFILKMSPTSGSAPLQLLNDYVSSAGPTDKKYCVEIATLSEEALEKDSFLYRSFVKLLDPSSSCESTPIAVQQGDGNQIRFDQFCQRLSRVDITLLESTMTEYLGAYKGSEEYLWKIIAVFPKFAIVTYATRRFLALCNGPGHLSVKLLAEKILEAVVASDALREFAPVLREDEEFQESVKLQAEKKILEAVLASDALREFAPVLGEDEEFQESMKLLAEKKILETVLADSDALREFAPVLREDEKFQESVKFLAEKKILKAVLASDALREFAPVLRENGEFQKMLFGKMLIPLDVTILPLIDTIMSTFGDARSLKQWGKQRDHYLEVCVRKVARDSDGSFCSLAKNLTELLRDHPHWLSTVASPEDFFGDLPIGSTWSNEQHQLLLALPLDRKIHYQLNLLKACLTDSGLAIRHRKYFCWTPTTPPGEIYHPNLVKHRDFCSIVEEKLHILTRTPDNPAVDLLYDLLRFAAPQVDDRILDDLTCKANELYIRACSIRADSSTLKDISNKQYEMAFSRINSLSARYQYKLARVKETTFLEEKGAVLSSIVDTIKKGVVLAPTDPGSIDVIMALRLTKPMRTIDSLSGIKELTDRLDNDLLLALEAIKDRTRLLATDKNYLTVSEALLFIAPILTVDQDLDNIPISPDAKKIIDCLQAEQKLIQQFKNRSIGTKQGEEYDVLSPSFLELIKPPLASETRVSLLQVIAGRTPQSLNSDTGAAFCKWVESCDVPREVIKLLSELNNFTNDVDALLSALNDFMTAYETKDTFMLLPEEIDILRGHISSVLKSTYFATWWNKIKMGMKKRWGAPEVKIRLESLLNCLDVNNGLIADINSIVNGHISDTSFSTLLSVTKGLSSQSKPVLSASTVCKLHTLLSEKALEVASQAILALPESVQQALFFLKKYIDDLDKVESKVVDPASLVRSTTVTLFNIAPTEPIAVRPSLKITGGDSGGVGSDTSSGSETFSLAETSEQSLSPVKRSALPKDLSCILEVQLAGFLSSYSEDLRRFACGTSKDLGEIKALLTMYREARRLDDVTKTLDILYPAVVEALTSQSFKELSTDTGTYKDLCELASYFLDRDDFDMILTPRQAAQWIIANMCLEYAGADKVKINKVKINKVKINKVKINYAKKLMKRFFCSKEASQDKDSARVVHDHLISHLRSLIKDNKTPELNAIRMFVTLWGVEWRCDFVLLAKHSPTDLKRHLDTFQNSVVATEREGEGLKNLDDLTRACFRTGVGIRREYLIGKLPSCIESLLKGQDIDTSARQFLEKIKNDMEALRVKFYISKDSCSQAASASYRFMPCIGSPNPFSDGEGLVTKFC